MSEEHVDKRNETQFPDERSRRRAHLAAGGTIANYDRSHYPSKNENKDPFDGGEDPWYSWNPENREEEARHYESEDKNKNNGS
jgi:hypothetical protein